VDAKEELEICGVRLRPGEPILFMLGAANRDPGQFRVPDRLDSKASEQSASGVWRQRALLHWKSVGEAGGAGGHSEAGAAVSADVAQQRAEWMPNLVLRGLKALPVVL